MIKVTCAIILKEEKVLVTQRSEQMKHPLQWEFPGGKVNKDETEEQCILREIIEELNIDIRIIQRLTPKYYDYGDLQISLIPFIAEFKSGAIQLTEHKDHQWVNRKELKKFDWVPADVLVLEDFLNR